MKPGHAPERLVGALLVVALHAAALWGLFNHRLITLPASAPTLFVDLIAPPEVQPPRPAPATPAQPKRPEPTRADPLPIVTAAPSAPAASEAPSAVATPLPPANAVAPAPTFAPPSGPLKLGGELAVSCPERAAPDYPLASRRRNETGNTLLHVELDETGQVATASVLESSGFPRLDAAALAAVRTWRCNPPQRNGRAVRAVARQAFNFVLQGN